MSDEFANYFRQGNKVANAVSTFTNRGSEFEIFEQRLRAHSAWKTTFDPTDINAPRLNLLNFYGIGGIGKSTLIREIQRRLAGPVDIPTVTLLVDFQEPTSFDTEDFILRVRSAAGVLGAPLTAFDISLALYWSVVHPEATLQTYVRKNSALRSVSERVGLSGAVQKAVVDVAAAICTASSLATAGTRLAQLVAKQLKNHGQTRHAIESCPGLHMFLDAEKIETALTYMPSLMAWDLAQAPPHRLIVFLDTYEEVTKRGRRIENWVQRICYLLPNVLFVISGRNRLDWQSSDLHGSLGFVGPQHWPGLVSDTADDSTVLVGDLTPSDADRYLQDRLRTGASPAIPSHIRQKIVEASGGWPLYLDIAVGYFQQKAAVGSVSVDDFGVPFPALVSRLMSDLTADERSVLSAASLFDTFDEELLHATVGSVDHKSVLRTLGRPFVKPKRSLAGVYSLHGTLRRALASDTSHWSTLDWKEAAKRAHAFLGKRAAKAASQTDLATCVVAGLGLSYDFQLPIDWLSSAAYRLAAEGGLEAVGALGPATNDPASALAALLITITQRRSSPFLEWAESLEAFADAPLSDVDRLWARSLRADALLSAGADQQAEALYREVLTEPPESPVVLEAKTMFALTRLKKSAFSELEGLIVSDRHGLNSERLLGDIYRCNAMWTEAADKYRTGLIVATQNGDVGLQALFRAELALVDGWTGENDPTRWIVRNQMDEFEPWTRTAYHLAQALYHAGRPESPFHEAIAEAEALSRRFGMRDGLLDVLVVRAFSCAVSGEVESLSDISELLGDLLSEQGDSEHWIQILAWWGGSDLKASRVQWLGSTETARSNWLATVRVRRLQCDPHGGQR